eukprot:CAMPEP_0203809300 /NCGR_PEP_ID=MMETSP0115-20131106/2192_1 /ASSEMBLY_ACC=CAM_ASM_000227 /TAXON_ID=33651 /ORGANISM="Bicosoecid sp, Strain ms1" /LENGTH=1066 /DNA_ID=CAMNT_0050718025 /DNA_START=94 /DNA_END=3294 /DNA_ORIENTATION=+
MRATSAAGRRHAPPESPGASRAALLAVVVACCCGLPAAGSGVSRSNSYEDVFSAVDVDAAPHAAYIIAPTANGVVSSGTVRIVVATQDAALVELVRERTAQLGDAAIEARAVWWDPDRVRWRGGMLAMGGMDDGSHPNTGATGLLLCVRLRDEMTDFTWRATCVEAETAEERGAVVDPPHLATWTLQLGVGKRGAMARGSWMVQAYLIDGAARMREAAAVGDADDDEACEVPGKLLAATPPTRFRAVNASSCTMETCWGDALQDAGCSADNYSVYAYPLEDAVREVSAEFAMLHATFASSPFATDDPRTACVMLPNVDTLCLYNDCDPVDVGLRLSMLPHWDGGRRHLVITIGDRRQMSMEVGRAVVAESSVMPVQRAHRPDFDVTFPLSFYRCLLPPFTHLERFANRPSTFDSVLAFRSRKYLLSFKGARYGEAPELPHLRVRSDVRALHNGRDVIIATFCTWRARDCRTGKLGPWHGASDEQCAAEDEAAAKYDYDALLTDSQYALITAGEGTHSYRLYEALGAGAIPVVVGAATRALPFPALIDWEVVAVIIEDDSTESLQRLVPFLRQLPMARRVAAHVHGRQVFDRWLRHLSSHVDGTLLTLHLSMFGKGGAKRQPEESVALMSPCQNDWSLWCWPAQRSGGPAREAQKDAAVAFAWQCKEHQDGGAFADAAACWRRVALLLGPAGHGLFTHSADAAAAHASLANSLAMLDRPVAALHASTMSLLAAGWSFYMVGDRELELRALSMSSAISAHTGKVLAARDAVGYDAQLPGPIPTLRACGAGERHPTVAIVSLCDYDAAVTTLTAYSMSNKVTYAMRHGYGLFVETERLDPGRPHAWSKLVAVRKYFSRAEWVVWMDCDSFFMRGDVRLEQFLPHDDQCVAIDGPGEGDAGGGVAGGDGGNGGDRVHLLSTADGVMLNTGVFIVRSHPWSDDLLQRAYGVDEFGNIAASPFDRHPWWEQGALYAALAPLVPPALDDATWELDATVTYSPAMGPHVRLLPQRWINAYPADLAAGLHDSNQNPVHAAYAPGDFIVSFSGCKVVLGAGACEKYFEEYWEAADL